MTILPNSLEARDIAYYFHPATNARRNEQIGPLVIESGHGVYVRDDQGKDYIEGLAGLWSVAVGLARSGSRKRRSGRWSNCRTTIPSAASRIRPPSRSPRGS